MPGGCHHVRCKTHTNTPRRAWSNSVAGISKSSARKFHSMVKDYTPNNEQHRRSCLGQLRQLNGRSASIHDFLKVLIGRPVSRLRRQRTAVATGYGKTTSRKTNGGGGFYLQKQWYMPYFSTGLGLEPLGYRKLAPHTYRFVVLVGMARSPTRGGCFFDPVCMDVGM
ncbi:hypothetical protein Bbelb_402420 [Branchiostoma belcheri]|nr:hypothetical protein Bbelb_402420 [Branchiostoma belcheri]